jgi:hypothetical protein
MPEKKVILNNGEEDEETATAWSASEPVVMYSIIFWVSKSDAGHWATVWPSRIMATLSDTWKTSLRLWETSMTA